MLSLMEVSFWLPHAHTLDRFEDWSDAVQIMAGLIMAYPDVQYKPVICLRVETSKRHSEGVS